MTYHPCREASAEVVQEGPSLGRLGPEEGHSMDMDLSRDCTVNVQLTSPAQDGGARIRVSFSFILHTYIYIYTVYRHTPLWFYISPQTDITSDTHTVKMFLMKLKPTTQSSISLSQNHIRNHSVKPWNTTNSVFPTFTHAHTQKMHINTCTKSCEKVHAAQRH